MEWKNVGAEKPQDGEYVDVWLGERLTDVVWDNEACIFFDPTFGIIPDVLWWMPIPGPPA